MNNETISYVSIYRIFSKLLRDFGLDTINEGDIIEWSAEALENIGAVTMYEEAVAFIEIKNHQANLPNGIHSIIQIAKNNCWDNTKKCGLCPSDIIDAEEEVEEESNPVPVPIDCNGQPITDYELAYYRPYFDLLDEAGYWSSQRMFTSCFTPVRLTNHTFFNSLVCKTDNYEHLYSSCSDEYTVVNGDVVRFSFQEGQIALSYTRQQLDENGYPLIPDHVTYTTAITKYIIYKMMERDFYSGREGSGTRLQKAEADWHWYCKQAKNRLLMPKGVDQLQNIMEQRQYMLPRLKRYYGFFGKMSRIESRKFNDSDNRNYFKGYNF